MKKISCFVLTLCLVLSVPLTCLASSWKVYYDAASYKFDSSLTTHLQQLGCPTTQQGALCFGTDDNTLNVFYCTEASSFVNGVIRPGTYNEHEYYYLRATNSTAVKHVSAAADATAWSTAASYKNIVIFVGDWYIQQNWAAILLDYQDAGTMPTNAQGFYGGSCLVATCEYTTNSNSGLFGSANISDLPRWFLENPSYNTYNAATDPDADVSAVQKELLNLQARVAAVESDIADVKVRLTSVESELSGLSSEMSTLNTNVEFILDHVTAIYNRLGEMKTQLSTVISSLSTINNNLKTFNDNVISQFTSMKDLLNARFDALQTVILYGDPEGESVTEEYENKLEGLSSDFDTYNSNIGSAASYVESSGQDVAAYIKTFTEIYNGAAAVAGLGAILTFGFAIIFIIKLIGR